MKITNQLTEILNKLNIPESRKDMTIAATYPAAVIGMAVLRIFRGSLLEENNLIKQFLKNEKSN